MPWTGWPKLQTFISYSFRDWEVPRSRCQWSHSLVRAHFLVCRWLSSVSQCWDQKEEASFLSIKALIPCLRVPPSWPYYLPMALPPNSITLEIRLQHMNLGWHRHLIYNIWIFHFLFICSSVDRHLCFFSLFDYYELRCYEHSCTSFCLDICFKVSWVYIQRQNRCLIL